jgi:hydroxypyruvate isomerase
MAVTLLREPQVKEESFCKTPCADGVVWPIMESQLSRRSFARAAAAMAGGFAVTSIPAHAEIPDGPGPVKFKHKYAPHFGMFEAHAGKDPLDQIKFIADQGFAALEDNGMMGRPVELQDKVAAEMERLGMTMGVFVSYADFRNPAFAAPTSDSRAMLRERMTQAVEVAKRVNAKWTTVVPGTYVNNMEWDYQTANVIETLKMLAGICEPHGLVMVLEPLNPWANHPGCFLTKIPQAYQICKAVGSPSCKILDDLYHQQITEGNLIPNMERAWDEIAYIQVGDNPGRKEPYTGEINYNHIFKWLRDKGYQGVVGMEHGKSLGGKEGEVKLLEAYRRADDFT